MFFRIRTIVVASKASNDRLYLLLIRMSTELETKQKKTLLLDKQLLNKTHNLTETLPRSLTFSAVCCC